jgi:phosphorylcholine metabolism protein LicD
VISNEQFSKGEVFYCFFKNSTQVFDVINKCASIALSKFLIHPNENVFANNLMINGSIPNCFCNKKEFLKKFSKVINVANHLRTQQSN